MQNKTKVKRIITQCRKNFIKSKYSLHGEKTICRHTVPIIAFNGWIKNNMGFAYCIHPNLPEQKNLRRRFNLSKNTANMYLPSDEVVKHYLVIDISKEIFRYSEDILFELVSHEFAHCIQYLICYNSDDHGEEWQRFHKGMGGSGNEFLELPELLIT